MPTQPSRKTLTLAIILTPILITGLLFLILWLTLKPHKPNFHIQHFSIQNFSNQNGLHNSHITYNLTIRNPNSRVWILYDGLRGSVYYKDYRVALDSVFQSYYQGPKNTTMLNNVFSGTLIKSNVDNKEWRHFVDDRAKGVVKFKLKFGSDVKYKKSIWDKKEHRMRVKCEIGLDPDGALLEYYRGKKCQVKY